MSHINITGHEIGPGNGGFCKLSNDVRQRKQKKKKAQNDIFHQIIHLQFKKLSGISIETPDNEHLLVLYGHTHHRNIIITIGISARIRGDVGGNSSSCSCGICRYTESYSTSAAGGNDYTRFRSKQ